MAEEDKRAADERIVPDRIREAAAETAAGAEATAAEGAEAKDAAAEGAAVAEGTAAKAAPAAAAPAAAPAARRRSRVPLVVTSVCGACVLAFAVGGFALASFSQEEVSADPWASTTVPVREVAEASSLDDYLAAAGEPAAEEPVAEEPVAEEPAAESPAPADAGATAPSASSDGGSSASAGSGGSAAAQPPASSGGSSAPSSGGSGASAGGSSSSSTPEAPPAPEPKTITVTIAVDGSKANASGYSVGLGARSVTLPEGATVYDALKATGLALGGGPSYVKSIGGLGEFACGAGSGWMYGVNGTYPKKACNAYKLSSGDSVRWVYTLDNGNDL